MVCGGQTGRLEVANELIKILKLEIDIKVTPVSSNYFKDIYFAERPPSERLINYKLNLRDLNNMQDWKIALSDYIQKYYNNYL
jgi:dTDP-4-dehydrorhamnose reductase